MLSAMSASTLSALKNCVLKKVSLAKMFTFINKIVFSYHCQPPALFYYLPPSQRSHNANPECEDPQRRQSYKLGKLHLWKCDSCWSCWCWRYRITPCHLPCRHIVILLPGLNLDVVTYASVPFVVILSLVGVFTLVFLRRWQLISSWFHFNLSHFPDGKRKAKTWLQVARMKILFTEFIISQLARKLTIIMRK